MYNTCIYTNAVCWGEGDQGDGKEGGGAIWENMLFTVIYILQQGQTWSGFFLWSLTDPLPNNLAI